MSRSFRGLTILVALVLGSYGSSAARFPSLKKLKDTAKEAAKKEALDAARITTKGLGDTKPAAPNTTAEGRAQNRRVEVVKL